MNKKWKLILWILAAIVILGAAFTTYSKLKPTDTVVKETQSEETNISSLNFTLKNMKGEEVSLSDYKDKYIFINFWAVWCKYCKQEMPELNEFSKEIAKENDAVLLAVDVQEDEKTVQEYIDENGFDMHILMDTEGAIAQKYGVSGYPTTFIINKDGKPYTYIPQATNKKTLEVILEGMRKGIAPDKLKIPD